jgi:splicing factor 3B subunit 3
VTVFSQVYPDGIRHIRADKRVNEWKAPGKKTIVKCAVNQRQVVIALTGGELVYFEMDPVSLNLIVFLSADDKEV